MMGLDSKQRQGQNLCSLFQIAILYKGRTPPIVKVPILWFPFGSLLKRLGSLQRVDIWEKEKGFVFFLVGSSGATKSGWKLWVNCLKMEQQMGLDIENYGWQLNNGKIP